MNFSTDNFFSTLGDKSTFCSVDSVDCINWCMEQQFVTYHNIKLYGLLILGGAIVVKYLGGLLVEKAKDLNEKQKVYILITLDQLLTCTVIAFILWALYFLP